MISSMTSSEIRSKLVDALRLDLIGPARSDDPANEILPSPPSRWYLTGFLVPHEAPEELRRDETGDEQLELAAATEAADDDGASEQVSKRKVFFPSSIGASVLVAASMEQVTVIAEWGDYAPNEVEEAEGKKRTECRRAQRVPAVDIVLATIGTKAKPIEIDGSDGIRLIVSMRNVTPSVARATAGGNEPCDCRAMSVFLVNHRSAETETRERKDERYIFQAAIRLQCS